MKTIGFVAAALTLSSAGAFAQSAEANITRNIPQIPLEEVEPFIYYQTNNVIQFFGSEVGLRGVVPQALAVDNPLQLVNPFAPPEYGSGYQNVTVNPETKKADGISIFAIKF